ncbi:MAG: metallophosphoesterase [Thermoplasmata archaeon]
MGVSSSVRDHLVAYLASHRKLAESQAIELLAADRQPLLFCQQVLEVAGPETPLITRELVEEVAERRGPRPGPIVRPESPTDGPAAPRRAAPPFQVLVQGFVAPPPHQDPLSAYGALFSDRYRRLSRLLTGRASLRGLRPIRELRGAEREASIIGMVREVRATPKQHHLIVTVEDETGTAECLLPKDSPLSREPILPDEVVGVSLALPKDRGRLPRVEGWERPDVPIGRVPGRADRPVRAIFLSDLHIGSKSFLADAWGRLVDFLGGKGPAPDLARSIEVAVVAGDLVDGIGIYPRQEQDLAIADVVEQYQELGRRLRELPPTMTIAVVPGNHDAVSPAEPQPALASGIAASLPPNVRSLGNPSTFAVHGVVVEAYHGRGFDDLIPAIPGASYGRPTDVMKRMLAMRHLAPIYGGRTPLAPLPRDGLVIDPVPDVLVTGHAHTYGVDRYRDVLLLNVSTWQGETEYQKMRNITAVPARATIVDLNRPGAADGIVHLDASGPSLRLSGGGLPA